MKLSNNSSKIDDAIQQNRNGVADMSIRAAAKLLPKPKTDEEKAAAKKQREDTKAAEKATEIEAAVNDKLKESATADRLFQKAILRSDPGPLAEKIKEARGRSFLDQLANAIEEILKKENAAPLASVA